MDSIKQLRKRLRPKSTPDAIPAVPQPVTTTPQPSATSPRLVNSTSSSTTEYVVSLWDDAIDTYKNTIGVDLRNESTAMHVRLSRCTSAEDIAAALQDAVKRFGDKRKGNKMAHNFRESLKFIVASLKVFLDVGAELASASAIPGGNGIFVALGVLLQAAERVSTRFDQLEKLFQQLQSYLTRLNVRVEGKLGREARALIVDALVCMLKAFMLTTKMMKEGRVERFVHALFAKTDDVQAIIIELQDIAAEEERLTITEIVVGMHKLSLKLDTVTNPLREDALASGQLHYAALYRIQSVVEEVRATVSCTQSRPGDDVGVRRVATEIHSVLSMFNPEDRAAIQRAMVLIYSLAANAVVYGNGNSMEVVIATCFSPSNVLAVFAPWAFTFIALFAAWRCIRRPLGFAPGRIVLIDVLGKTFIIEDDTFLTWEKTQAFLVRSFAGRLGLEYVMKGDYSFTQGDHTKIIDSKSWSGIVRPGVTIEMAIVKRHRYLRCPWCKCSSEEAMCSPGRQIQCSNRHCRQIFRAHKDDHVAGEARNTFETYDAHQGLSRIPEMSIDNATSGSGNHPSYLGITPARAVKDSSSDLSKFRQIIVRFSGETAWPPYLESALVEALDKYRPESLRSTRTLGRFPDRNRFISNYIYHVTGKRRTAKQVGSRLKQLRNTCGGKRILELLSSRDYSDDESVYPGTSVSSALNGFEPSRALVTIDVLPADAPWSSSHTGDLMLTLPLSSTRGGEDTESEASEEAIAEAGGGTVGGEVQATVSTFRSPFVCPFRAIDPTVRFTSAAWVRAISHCAVYFNGNCVHRESTPMQVNQIPDNTGYVCRVALAPGFWQKLCESNDPGRYSIVQKIMQCAIGSSPLSSPSLSAEIPPSASILLTVVYQFQEPTSIYHEAQSVSVSPETSPSPTPAPSQAQLHGHTLEYGQPLAALCDASTYFPQLPLSPVSATFSDVSAPSHQQSVPLVQ